MCSKWLHINEDLSCKRIINCTNVGNLKIWEITCSELDVNGITKLVRYNGMSMKGHCIAEE